MGPAGKATIPGVTRTVDLPIGTRAWSRNL